MCIFPSQRLTRIYWRMQLEEVSSDAFVNTNEVEAAATRAKAAGTS